MMHLQKYKGTSLDTATSWSLGTNNSLTTRPGFTFIEIMIALMLLVIAGTSLFMMQSTIFQNVSKSHSAVCNILELDKEMINLKIQITQAIKQKKELKTVKIHSEKSNPIRTVDIAIKPIKENSQLFKKFEKNIRIIEATTTRDKKTEQWITFLFTPPKQEEPAPKTQEAK